MLSYSSHAMLKQAAYRRRVPRRVVPFGMMVVLCVAVATGGSPPVGGPRPQPSTNPAAGQATLAPGPHDSRSGPDLAVPDLVPPTPITYWPSASNTGVPAGTVLRNSGSLALRTAGQVVTGLNIAGCVTVYASNVKITRSRITCNSTTYSVRALGGVRGLVMEDVEINGGGLNSAAVCCSDFVIRRANIYNVIDGPRLGNNTTVIDSYIHNLARVPSSHNDSFQTTGGDNILIQHNRIETYNATLKDPMNACLMIGSTTAPSVTNLLMTDNYCNGGNYSIGVRTDLVASNVRITRNKFGRNYRYGVIARPSQAGIFWERSSNVWFDNGLPVVP
jgi:hypothetical protein